MLALLIVAVVTVAYCLVGRRMEEGEVTAPMLFIGLGVLVSQVAAPPRAYVETGLHVFAAVALVLLLFLDAAQTYLASLRRSQSWPMRMLFIGLPATVALGGLAAWLLLPGWLVAAALLVAAILAPTNAALGRAVVSNPLVPARVRRALTVESGLNDGLALPLVLLFASLTAQATGQDGAG